MSMYDKIALGQQAAERGFVRDTYEKVLRLVDILLFINSDPLLSGVLALKGGTAINLTVFDLPRLSVDIDLDYTRNNSREEMLAEREQISDVVGRHMATLGYRPAQSRLHHSLDATVWAYTNSAGVNDNIKIEINYSLRAHALPMEHRPVHLPITTLVTTLAPTEIFASKIVALLTRGAARDLYDINNLVEHGLFSNPTDADLLRRVTVLYLAVGTDTIPNPLVHTSIMALTERKIRTELQPVLRKRDWFDLSSAQHRVTGYLTDLLSFTSDELRFLDSFEAGAWKPELVFSGDALERVRVHPMAAWKTGRLSDAG